MMSSVTRTRRFCANMGSSAICVYYIMRSDDMQEFRSLAHRAHTLHLDLVYNRQDLVSNRCCMHSRDRSRRT